MTLTRPSSDDACYHETSTNRVNKSDDDDDDDNDGDDGDDFGESTSSFLDKKSETS